MNKYAKETWVGIFVLIGLLCVAYLTLTLGDLQFFESDTYTLKARFSSVAGLHAGADVEVAGVPVGTVTDIVLDQEYGVALVTMEIDNDVELFDDVIAAVKTSGLIGDKYINLNLGDFGDQLQDGDFIAETQGSIDLEALISKYVFGEM